jgi:hypothetical protein
MAGWDSPTRPGDPWGSSANSGAPPKLETVELIGPHLRVSGQISLLRFTRLSDLVNHSRGYVKVAGAQVLRRNGEPAGQAIQELMINQDEVTFIAQTEQHLAASPTAASDMDRPMMQRVPREIVIFTEAHTLTGHIHLFGETEIDNFVDSSDPRFVPMTDVTVRWLADRRVVDRFGLVLVNRSQMLAAALREKAGTAAETGVGAE